MDVLSAQNHTVVDSVDQATAACRDAPSDQTVASNRPPRAISARTWPPGHVLPATLHMLMDVNFAHLRTFRTSCSGECRFAQESAEQTSASMRVADQLLQGKLGKEANND